MVTCICNGPLMNGTYIHQSHYMWKGHCIELLHEIVIVIYTTKLFKVIIPNIQNCGWLTWRHQLGKKFLLWTWMCTFLSRDTAGTSCSKVSLKPWFRSVQVYSHVFIQNIIECLQHKTTKTKIYEECTAVRFQIFG